MKKKYPHGINNFSCVMSLSNYKKNKKYFFKEKSYSVILSKFVIKPFVHCPWECKAKRKMKPATSQYIFILSNISYLSRLEK